MINRKKKKATEEEQVTPPLQQGLQTVSPMWDWCNRFRELFDSDPDIKVGVDGIKNPTIILVVNNQVKALCIEKIVPKTKEFDEGKVTIEVKIADHFGGEKYLKDVVFEAFKGNPLFDYQYWWEDPEHFNNPRCWVAMKPSAIFWPSSDLHNTYGDSYDLPSNIAQQMLDPQTDFIFYTSDNTERPAPDHNTRFFN